MTCGMAYSSRGGSPAVGDLSARRGRKGGASDRRATKVRTKGGRDHGRGFDKIIDGGGDSGGSGPNILKQRAGNVGLLLLLLGLLIARLLNLLLLLLLLLLLHWITRLLLLLLHWITRLLLLLHWMARLLLLLLHWITRLLLLHWITRLLLLLLHWMAKLLLLLLHWVTGLLLLLLLLLLLWTKRRARGAEGLLLRLVARLLKLLLLRINKRARGAVRLRLHAYLPEAKRATWRSAFLWCGEEEGGRVGGLLLRRRSPRLRPSLRREQLVTMNERHCMTMKLRSGSDGRAEVVAWGGDLSRLTAGGACEARVFCGRTGFGSESAEKMAQS